MVRRLGRLPLMSLWKISGLPCIEEENINWEPSGDQVGALLVPRKRAKDTGRPVSSEYMQICALTTPKAGAKHVKAMREPSGDHRGVSAMECREVSAC